MAAGGLRMKCKDTLSLWFILYACKVNTESQLIEKKRFYKLIYSYLSRKTFWNKFIGSKVKFWDTEYSKRSGMEKVQLIRPWSIKRVCEYLEVKDLKSPPVLWNIKHILLDCNEVFYLSAVGQNKIPSATIPIKRLYIQESTGMSSNTQRRTEKKAYHAGIHHYKWKHYITIDGKQAYNTGNGISCLKFHFGKNNSRIRHLSSELSALSNIRAERRKVYFRSSKECYTNFKKFTNQEDKFYARVPKKKVEDNSLTIWEFVFPDQAFQRVITAEVFGEMHNKKAVHKFTIKKLCKIYGTE